MTRNERVTQLVAHAIGLMLAERKTIKAMTDRLSLIEVQGWERERFTVIATPPKMVGCYVIDVFAPKKVLSVRFATTPISAPQRTDLDVLSFMFKRGAWEDEFLSIAAGGRQEGTRH